MKERLPEKLRGGKEMGRLLEDSHRLDSESGDGDPKLIDAADTPAVKRRYRKKHNKKDSYSNKIEGIANHPIKRKKVTSVLSGNREVSSLDSDYREKRFKQR